MNFLDAYDAAGTITPPPSQPEQSLNEEVSQVIGQLGRFWGGFRRQSQSALEIARKDLSEVVTQAQRELSKLSTSEPINALGPETEGTPAASTTPSDTTENTDSTPPNAESSTSVASTSTLSIFSRLQSALPPNIVSTVQAHLPDTIKHASGNIDLAQMRTTLFSELQRVQGVTRAQAEEYAHKSEILLREAMKEAESVLRDAVKVIPPEETGSSNEPSGLVWDGSDMWMLPSESLDTNDGTRRSGSRSRRGSSETQRAVATRAESLLRRLKHNPDIIRHDPETDERARAAYMQWLIAKVDSNPDGIDADEWISKATELMDESGDGEALKATQDTLVPSELTMDVFWKRFFFRVHQIEQEEVKRKTLLISSTENDEDFSWDDDEDATVLINPETLSIQPSDNVPSSSTGSTPSTVTELPSITLVKSAAVNTQTDSESGSRTHTSATASPRESSEDGFDVVSPDDSDVSTRGKERSSGRHSGDEDEGDSDWE